MFVLRPRPTDLARGLTRRRWLEVGLGGGALASAFAAQSSFGSDSRAGGPPGFGRAKSCILIYLFGGPSHIDIWDMKPDAPDGVRGEFKPIATNVPGIRITEHLPRLGEADGPPGDRPVDDPRRRLARLGLPHDDDRPSPACARRGRADARGLPQLRLGARPAPSARRAAPAVRRAAVDDLDEHQPRPRPGRRLPRPGLRPVPDRRAARPPTTSSPRARRRQGARPPTASTPAAPSGVPSTAARPRSTPGSRATTASSTAAPSTSSPPPRSPAPSGSSRSRPRSASGTE